MKKVMMTAMLMLAMTAAMAQNERPAKMDATSLTELLVKQLGLSSTQKTKVSALNKKYESVLGGPGMGRPRHDENSNSSNCIFFLCEILSVFNCSYTWKNG